MIHLTQAEHDAFKAAVAEPRERPILFNGDMVRALLAGTKQQTRRLCKAAKAHDDGEDYRDVDGWPLADFSMDGAGDVRVASPYGEAGTRLWVRESCWIYGRWEVKGVRKNGKPSWRFVQLGQHVRYKNPVHEEMAYWGGGEGWAHRPSIHVPRWASRILLEITEVRVERLQAITEADARAEGITDGGCLNCGNPEPCGCSAPAPDARDAYAWLWMSINGDDSWAENPWVWVVSFKVVQP